MMERKFTKGLSKPGSAAQVRETVSQVVRQSTELAKPQLVEPIDYETFITKNKTVLNNDLQRDMLVFPPDDVSQSKLPRRFRTVVAIDQNVLKTEISNQFVKECLKTYTRDWHEVHYKYNAYSGSYSELSKIPKPENLEDQVYEVDKAINPTQDVLDSSRKENEITKQGYLLKGPESGSETFISSIATKSFKRKYVFLKRQIDSSYILEFHKDDKKADAKFTICMDCCSDVIRNTRKGGKFSFELKMQDSHKSYILAAENEAELEDWINKLKQVLHLSKQEENNIRLTSEDNVDSPPITPEHQGTLKSLVHSKNPDLMKYARETDISIALSRKENRQNIFAIYPELKPNSVDMFCDAEVEPYKEKFGIKLFVRFESIKFELQMPSQLDNVMCQVEPYMTTASLFDAKTGRKLSEEFRFDINHSSVRGMIPSCKPRGRSDSIKKNGNSASSDRSPLKQSIGSVLDEGFDENWLATPSQAIFDVKHPDSDIYLVIRIEKILQGAISHVMDPYLKGIKNGDFKLGCKVNKAVRSSILRLGHYRMPFAWTARPLFESGTEKCDSQSHILPIYKQESSKSSDEDIAKYLSEWRRSDKKHRLTLVPGQIKIYIERLEKKIPNCLTSSLMPIRPFPVPPTHNLSVEVQDFLSENLSDCYPCTVYTNLLYAFPKSLNYEAQKSFAKARNIACVVELRDCDTADAVPLPCIFGRPGEPLFTTQARCAVVHHSTFPEFYEEIKIALPVQLRDHHLLFTFLHVSCEPSKNSKKKDLPVENVIGYSWIPIYQADKILLEEQSFPVAANLPPNYLSCKPLGLGKGYSGPDIQWVDGQKCLFKCDVKLISTVYTKDKHLNNFFANVQKFLLSNVQINDSELSKNLKDDVRFSSGSELSRDFSHYVKALHAIDVGIIINFMPTILNQLFSLLLCNINEDVSLNVIRIIVHIIHTVSEAKKLDILISYVKYVFQVDYDMSKKSTTIHEELVKSLTITLRPVNADFLVINKVMRHSWFFFNILVKSMAQYLLTTGKIKMNRHERFSSDFMYRIQTFLQGIMPHISQKFKEYPEETKQANRNLAFFIKKCLTFMDRGYVFKLINIYMDMFNLGDHKVLQEYKFEFLQIVISHEHYVALNLPLMRCNLKKYTDLDSKDEIETIPVLEHEYRLHSTFCRNHFLTGIILQEVRLALNEVRDIRKLAITVLRNQLAKHAFDDRYQNKICQAKIASLYLPFVTVILENLNRLVQPDIHIPNNQFNDGTSSISTLSSNSSATWYSIASSAAPISVVATPTTSQRQLLHRNTVGPDTFSAVVHNGKHKRDSSYLSVIAGQAGLPLDRGSVASGISLSSLNSSSSTLSAGSITDVDRLESFIDDESKTKVEDATRHARNHSVPLNNVRYDKLTATEVKDLLVCFLYILKNVNDDPLIGFWEQCSATDILDFFQVLEVCLYQFKYLGRKHIANTRNSNNAVGPKSLTLPARISPPDFANSNNCKTISSCNGKGSPDLEQDSTFRALLEANCATEIGLITLDVLGLYCNHFKEELLLNDGGNVMMNKISDIYLSFLQVGQSEKLLQHLFAALRGFITKFSIALYKGSAALCGKLCYEILKCCSSCLTKTRNEACALLYLLMRGNYEFTRRKGLTRVHLQVVISVSQLLGCDVGLNCTRFQESLSIINNYATSDKAMQSTNFPAEVKDLTKRIRTVLMATMQMREHESDPEMLVDLQHSLANSYAGTLELRKTWLESIKNNHISHGNLSEAAMSSIHIASLVSEYLKQKGIFSSGCKAFEKISPNILQDECRMKEDAGIEDVPYTEDTLLEMLEESVDILFKAERYEMIAEVYKIIIPIYEKRKNFEALSCLYKQLHNAYTKLVEVNQTGRRLMGKYYRVAFFGQEYFEDESEKEYVYKEPKVTSLPEISERLYRLFCDKFGKDAVKMIMDSVQINPKELDPKYAYVQVTHVVPYFDSREADQRVTDYERNDKVDRFVFETPFTLGGKKPRGALEEQCKRKTILTTIYKFPYVKKRIAVKSKQVFELKPIEVAIEEMETRILELNEVVECQPHDLKKLQLKLQGSVSVQVNAGPLAYAVAFLDDKHINKYSKDHTSELKEVYRNFIRVCAEALELNGKLISPDQEEYHAAMKENFNELVNGLSEIFHEKFLITRTPSRNSTIVFNCISTSGTSSA